MEKQFVEIEAVTNLVDGMVKGLIANKIISSKDKINIYGVPRGGIPVAYAMLACLRHQGYYNSEVVGGVRSATIIVDDLIDSGATKRKYDDITRGKPFCVLIDKKRDGLEGVWFVFPWETGGEEDMSADDIPLRLLQYIGENPEREGLIETPKRFLKAWQHWTSGYDKKAEDILKTFSDGAEDYNEMVTVVNIPFYSKCEHHLADIFGTATIGYIPNLKKPKVVGLSKLSRILDMYARRLQVQERLTVQVAKAIDKHLEPLGVGVHIKARHMCMESRGICKQGHHTETTVLLGAMRKDPAARAEFLRTTNS